MLILNGAHPYHWALSGALIGLITLVMLFVTNRRLGVSTGFENMCAAVVRSPYFARDEIKSSSRWRLPFLAGLVAGGALAAVATGGWRPLWDLGMFDGSIGFGPRGKLAWMFIGGVFIGFGTRLAGGCTSGHGIFGISNLEGASVRSTLAFMVTGILTTTVIYRLAVGG